MTGLVLVTGGAGYIGSHAVRALQCAGFRPLVLDNLVYGHRRIVEDVLHAPLVVGQLADRSLLDKILSGEHPLCDGVSVSAVLHFAAYAYVGESVADPARYYRNNVGDSLTLLEALQSEAARRGSAVPLVFSSTCATYGIPSKLPINEATEQLPINPYGRSKWMVEQMIRDFGFAYGQPSVIFRYFNAAGADPSGDLGELHHPETHLIPLVCAAVTGCIPYLQVFGDDYDTPDGTCIRDYIHVSDLADAHVRGLRLLLQSGGQHVFNLGTGNGFSVQEVIKTAELVTGKSVPLRMSPRRQGDPPILVASASRAEQELGWRPRYHDLKTIIQHAWLWHQQQVSIEVN